MTFRSGRIDPAVRDAAAYPDSPEMIATYLKLAFEEKDAALIRTALNDVARDGAQLSVSE